MLRWNENNNITAQQDTTFCPATENKTITTYHDGTIKIVTRNNANHSETIEITHKDKTKSIRIYHSDGRKEFKTQYINGTETKTQHYPNGKKHIEQADGVQILTPIYLDARINPDILTYNTQKSCWMLKSMQNSYDQHITSADDPTNTINLRMIKTPIGSGGYGNVHLGQNIDTGEWVAIKIFRDDKEKKQRKFNRMREDNKERHDNDIKKQIDDQEKKRIERSIQQLKLNDQFILADKNNTIIMKLHQGIPLEYLIHSCNKAQRSQGVSLLQLLAIAKDIVKKVFGFNRDTKWIIKSFNQPKHKISRRISFHRDLKIENMILNPSNHQIALCDFDSAVSPNSRRPATAKKKYPNWFESIKIVTEQNIRVLNYEIGLNISENFVTAYWWQDHELKSKSLKKSQFISAFTDEFKEITLNPEQLANNKIIPSKHAINFITQIYGCTRRKNPIANDFYQSANLTGTEQMIAPELINAHVEKNTLFYSEKTEVFACGMTLAEILNFVEPNPVKFKEHKRFCFKEKIPLPLQKLADFVKLMIHDDKNERPSMNEACIVLNQHFFAISTDFKQKFNIMILSISEILEMENYNKDALIESIIAKEINMIVLQSTKIDIHAEQNYYQVRHQLFNKNIIFVADFFICGDNQLQIARTIKNHFDLALSTINSEVYAHHAGRTKLLIARTPVMKSPTPIRAQSPQHSLSPSTRLLPTIRERKFSIPKVSNESLLEKIKRSIKTYPFLWGGLTLMLLTALILTILIFTGGIASGPIAAACLAVGQFLGLKTIIAAKIIGAIVIGGLIGVSITAISSGANAIHDLTLDREIPMTQSPAQVNDHPYLRQQDIPLSTHTHKPAPVISTLGKQEITVKSNLVTEKHDSHARRL